MKKPTEQRIELEAEAEKLSQKMQESWAGKYFGPNGTLRASRELFKKRKKLGQYAEAHAGRASATFSAATHFNALDKKGLWGLILRMAMVELTLVAFYHAWRCEMRITKNPTEATADMWDVIGSCYFAIGKQLKIKRVVKHAGQCFHMSATTNDGMEHRLVSAKAVLAESYLGGYDWDLRQLISICTSISEEITRFNQIGYMTNDVRVFRNLADALVTALERVHIKDRSFLPKEQAVLIDVRNLTVSIITSARSTIEGLEGAMNDQEVKIDALEIRLNVCESRLQMSAPDI